jgi:hypothetical protein
VDKRIDHLALPKTDKDKQLLQGYAQARLGRRRAVYRPGRSSLHPANSGAIASPTGVSERLHGSTHAHAPPRAQSFAVSTQEAQPILALGPHSTRPQVYVKEIGDLLLRMPRPLLLLLKTNDCLRSVDHALGSPLNTVRSPC